MWNRFFLVGGGGGGHENFYLLNVCCLGGSPKNLLGVEGGLPKKFFLICKILIAPHHINYECSLSVNKLSINATKTKFVLFRSRNKKPAQSINISINNENIKQEKHTTFLGIVIDEFLTWYYFKNSTLYNSEFLKTNLLCISLSISNLW